MNFRTTVVELKKALQVLTPIVNHNHQTLSFRYLLIRRRDSVIEFKAFNDYTIGSAFVGYSEFSGEPESEQYFVLGKHIMGLVSSFGKEDLEFSLEETKCKLKCGRSKYTLPTLDTKIANDSLKELDINYYDVSQSITVDIKLDKFTTAYNSISHCLSKDDSQRNLQNIYFADGKLLACDGIKGATIDFPIEASFDGKKDLNYTLMLHKQACDCILNIKTNTIQIWREDDRIYGSAAGFIFATTTEDDYPYADIRTIIDSFDALSFKSIIKIDPDEIIDKLNRVLMFADEDTNAIQVSFDKKELSLDVDNKSKAQEIINVFENEKGESMSIFLDGRSLKEALNKSLSESRWYTNGKDEVQYVFDGDLLQFFMGLAQ